MNTELYVSKVRAMFPGLCDGHDLRVGWKISRPDGTTHAGYFWPLVNRNHWDRTPPVLHEATAWNPANRSSCPAMEGDGLCVTLAVRHATSGGVPLTDCIGHVLVYPADLAVGNEDGKLRVPWCVDVDSFSPLALIREGLCANLRRANLGSADLRGANLWGANLGRANLGGANLWYANLGRANLGSADLRYANLGRANLRDADLRYADLGFADLWCADLRGADLWCADLGDANLGGAYLGGANYSQETVFPSSFDPTAAGMVRS